MYSKLNFNLLNRFTIFSDIGGGYPNREAAQDHQPVTSRTDCFNICSEMHEKDKSWSGLAYCKKKQLCECYKKPTGLNKHPGFVYYQFEQ